MHWLCLIRIGRSSKIVAGLAVVSGVCLIANIRAQEGGAHPFAKITSGISQTTQERYRILVRIPARDLNGRAIDRMPARLKIDQPLDPASLTITRYDPHRGRTVPGSIDFRFDSGQPATDLAGNTGPTTLDAIEQNYAAMADIAVRNGVVPVLSSLLPIHDHGPEKMTQRRSPDQILALNSWLRQYCADHHLIYLDYFHHMVGGDGMLRAELSDDGLHPNAAGFSVMAPLAERAIEAALVPKPGAGTRASFF